MKNILKEGGRGEEEEGGKRRREGGREGRGGRKGRSGGREGGERREGGRGEEEGRRVEKISTIKSTVHIQQYPERSLERRSIIMYITLLFEISL